MRRALVSGMVVVALRSTGCETKPEGKSEAKPQLPALDAAAAEQAAAALEEAPPEMRSVIAASALYQLEKGRFPEAYLAGLDAVSSAPPEMRSTMIAKAVSDHLSLFDDACAADATDTLRKLAELAPEQRAEHLWTSCKFTDLGLISESQGMQASDWGLILGHSMYARVRAAGEVDPNEKKLLKILASAAADEPEPVLD